MIVPTGFERVVVDSSGWIEYLAEGSNAERFSTYLNSGTGTLLLPSLVAYEVYKKLYREKDKQVAMKFISAAYEPNIRLITLTLELAIDAAVVSVETHLPMADAIIYTSALKNDAQLITSDEHFANLPHVTLI